MATSVIKSNRWLMRLDLPANGSASVVLSTENTYLIYGTSNVHGGLVCVQTNNSSVAGIYTFIQPYNVTYTYDGRIVTATNSTRYNIPVYVLALPK